MTVPIQVLYRLLFTLLLCEFLGTEQLNNMVKYTYIF